MQIIKQAPMQTKPDISDKGLYKDSAIGELMLNDASVSAFHAGILTVAVLIMAGGVISLIGIRNPAPK